MHISGFSDLCIPFTNDKKVLVETVKQLIEFGYRNVAIEQTVDFTNEKAIPKVRDIFPEPVDLSFLNEFREAIRILTRLTIIYNHVSISHYMTNSLNLKRFDLVAGMPVTDQALQHCCQTFNGDLVCFSLDKAHINFSRKYYNLAIDRKMYFEIRYAPAIIDSNHRRDIIRRSASYHSYGKSRNIILSSGATNYIQLRSPYEVAHLGLLFGLTEEMAKNSMVGNCRNVLLRSTARRSNKAVMLVDVHNDKEEQDDGDEDDQDEEMETDPVGEVSFEGQPSKKKKLDA